MASQSFDASIENIVESAYLASFDNACWDSVVKRTGALFQGAPLGLWGVDFQTGTHLGQLYSGFAPEAIAQFEGHYSAINAWGPGLAAAPVGSLLWSEDVLPREELIRTEYYNDWLRPQENLVASCGGILLNDGTRFLAVGASLRENDEDWLRQPVSRVLKQVIPHFTRAFRMSRMFSNVGSGLDLTNALQQIADAAFVLDAIGRVRFHNEKGGDLLSRRELVDAPRSGLRFHDALADTAFASQFAALRTRAYASPVPDWQAVSKSGQSFSATLLPLARDPDLGGDFLAQFISERPVGLLLLRAHTATVGEVLARDHGLTAGEVDVAIALGNGRTVDEIAERRRVSRHTVRNQIRAVFDKTGLHRQVELVAFLGHIERDIADSRSRTSQ